MVKTPNRYPALIHKGLTPVYDLFVKLFFPENRFKRTLITHAHIAPRQIVLDVGAGTGTLTIMAKKSQPEAQITGLDGDPQILTIARQKAARAGVEVIFLLASAAAMPYRDGSFDRVLSSLVFSLLDRETKQLALFEAFRVLKEGGALYIADFGPPHTKWGRWLAPRMRRFGPIADHLDGLLPVLFRQAGFERVEERDRFATVFGTLAIFHGLKPVK